MSRRVSKVVRLSQHYPQIKSTLGLGLGLGLGIGLSLSLGLGLNLSQLSRPPCLQKILSTFKFQINQL
jgi:hypothetical protein